MTGDAANELLKPMVATGQWLAKSSIGRILLLVVGLTLLGPSAFLAWVIIQSGTGGPGTALFLLPLMVSIGSLALALHGYLGERKRRRQERRKQLLRLFLAVTVGFSVLGAAIVVFVLARRRSSQPQVMP